MHRKRQCITCLLRIHTHALACCAAGATCYLNSWLQTLFNITCFREVCLMRP